MRLACQKILSNSYYVLFDTMDKLVLVLIFAVSLSFAFSALMLLVGRQEGHPACKKLSGVGAGVVICLE